MPARARAGRSGLRGELALVTHEARPAADDPPMPKSRVVDHDVAGEPHSISAEKAIRRIAERQHGIVTRAQLRKLGLGKGLIDYRLATERIDEVHRGVYALNAALLTREGRWLAAALAVGEDGASSHHSAAALWSIRRGSGLPPHVTCPRALRPRPGIKLHRLPLADDEITRERGIPVTTPARTLLDLAACLPPTALRRAAREADFLRLTSTGPSLPELLDRYRGRTGSRAARALLETGWAGGRTRSNHEERFLELIERSRLPRPEINGVVEVGGEWFEVDFIWRGARLIVEVDDLSSHGMASAFEADRRRDRILQAAGFQVLRVTPRQIATEGGALTGDLRRLLDARRCARVR